MLKNEILPSLFAAGSSVLIYKMLGGDLSQSVNVMNVSIPTPILVGGTVFASDMASTTIANYAAPYLPEALKPYETHILPPLASGLSVYGLLRGFVSENTSIETSLLIGAGSNIAGKYASEMI
jgi:hypothetical protein